MLNAQICRIWSVSASEAARETVAVARGPLLAQNHYRWEGETMVQSGIIAGLRCAGQDRRGASFTVMGCVQQQQHPHAAMSPPLSTVSAARSRSHLERPQGYDTIIALVLEKGSVTTFKAVHQRLQADWRLDAMQSPRTSVIGVPASSLDQRLMA